MTLLKRDEIASYFKACLNLNLDELKSAKDLPVDLKMVDSGRLSVYFAPFGLVHRQSFRVLFVGLTPGFNQVFEAIRVFQEAKGDLEKFQSLAHSIAFKGSMRRDIVAALDTLGLHRHLKIGSTSELFTAEDAQFCSLIRYPVFLNKNLKNYPGDSAVFKEKILKEMIEDYFIPILHRSGHSIIIPMGKWPSLILKELSKDDSTLESRVLFDFPHMSGANGHRKALFEKGRGRWRKTIAEWSKDMRVI